MTIRLDHIAIATPRRDAILADLVRHTGLSPLDGYAPGGQVAARGLRFANGPFLDIHQAPVPTEGTAPAAACLIGLEGDVDAAEHLAHAQGWRVVADRRRDSDEAQGDVAPWSLLSFRRRQGLLSAVFVIQYHHEAHTSAVYDRPLYRPPSEAAGAAILQGLAICVDDPEVEGQSLQALGFQCEDAGIYGDGRVAIELVAAAGRPPGLFEVRIQAPHAAADVPLDDALTAVIRPV